MSLLQGGREFFVAITAQSANSIPAKIEIWAKIIKSTVKKSSTRLTSYPRNPVMPNSPVQQPAPAESTTQQNSNSNIVYTADNKTLRVTDGEIAQTGVDGETAQTGGDGETGQTGGDGKTELQSSSSENISQESTTSTTTTNSIGDLSPKQEQSAKINILLIPSIVILSSLIISGIIAYLFRKKLCRKRHKISKDDMVSNSIRIIRN